MGMESRLTDNWPILVAIAFTLMFGWLLSLLVWAERYSRYVSRWIYALSGMFSLRLHRVAQGIMSLILFLVWVLGGLTTLILVTLFMGESQGAHDIWVVVLFVWLILSMGLGVVTVVVAYTGRPRGLVIKPCRGRSAREVERWVRTSAQMPGDWRRFYRDTPAEHASE
jgi:hypothetical protein